jgi:hypothetical protein
MNTFDAIAYIEDQSMNRSDAMKFLIERLGINSTYADEIVAIVFSGRSTLEDSSVPGKVFAARSA